MPGSPMGYTLKIKEWLQRHSLMIASLVGFLVLGLYLVRYSLPNLDFTEEGLIYDTIWLDAWSLAFILSCALLWFSKLSWRTKALIGVVILGVYGFVEIGLIFHGTPFSSNAYWGDQKFRQAMIMKFMEFGYATDFYYKDLPPFYPPLWYLLLAGIGKLLSVPAYGMLKIGGMLIFLCGPLLLYWLWRPLAGKLGAWLVTLFTFLVCASPAPYMMSAPHAFVASMIFIPWWLRYVDGVRGPRNRWLHWSIGGFLGAVIISTYFYPLLVGVFLLALRAMQDLRRVGIKARPNLRWRRTLGVIVASLVLSSWYWLPALWSVMETGFDRSRGGWHHIDSTSIGLMFTSFSWVGVLFVGGIVFAASRWRNRTHRSLLLLLAAVIPYLLVGSIMGGKDLSINLVKARDLVNVFAGPFIGLAAAAFLRCRSSAKTQWFAPAVSVVALLVLCHQFNNYAKSDLVENARKTQIPTWGTDAAEMETRAGSVFLSGHENFVSFFPVYTFLAVNEHYSHPACRFKERYDLLDLLEKVSGPRIVNIALRRNKYDKVDYFLPHVADGSLDITISLSNYPNKYATRVFKLPEVLVADSSLFAPCTGDHLYRVMNPQDTAIHPLAGPLTTDPDTLSQQLRLAMIRDKLSSEGQGELDAWIQVDWTPWRRPVEAEKATVFGDSVQLKDLRIVSDGDSLHLLMAFEAIKKVSRRLRVLVHSFVGDVMNNYDFDPKVPTDSWGRYETIICQRTIARPHGPFRLFVGLFDNGGRLPGIWRADLTP